METNLKKSTTEKQLVVFAVASESYGMDIGKVSEIIRSQEITHVPRTARFVQGVINLRGKVIPVVNLRKVFRLSVAEQSKENRIVVVDIQGQHVGIMVDAVTQVLRISSDCIEPPSSLINSGDTEYLLGIARLEKKMITLLDMEKLLSMEQMTRLSAVVSGDGAQAAPAGESGTLKKRFESEVEAALR